MAARKKKTTQKASATRRKRPTKRDDSEKTLDSPTDVAQGASGQRKPPNLDELYERTMILISDSIDGLELALSAAKGDLFDTGGKYRDRAGSHVAYLGGCIPPLANALRQMQAEDRRRVPELSPQERFDAVLEFAQELTAEDRRKLAEQITTGVGVL